MRCRVKVKPFDDVEFRRALHHAIPKKRILDVVFEGQGIVGQNTPLSPLLKPWHNDKIPFVDFDLEKSKGILAKAGYTRDEKGRLCYPKKG